MKHRLVRAIPWLITLLLILFWVRKGGDLRDFGAVLVQAKWPWLVGALLAQAGTYAAVAWLNELILRHYRVYVPWFRQYIIQYAMSFVEAALPSMAVSGLVLRVRLLKPYGASATVATISTLTETLLISISVAVPALLFVGYEILDGSDNRLQPFTLVAALVLLAGLFYLLRSNPRARLLWQTSVERVADWWDRRVLVVLPASLAAWPSVRIRQEASRLLQEWGVLLRQRPFPIGATLFLRTACEGLALLCCFRAFDVSISLTGLLLVYTITITINTLGAVPGGVGLAEVLLATVYTQFAITPEIAAAVALAYRVTGYWTPRLVGALSWLWLERQHQQASLLPEADL